MADVSVKMGVSGVQEFKNQMAQAQATVKNVDAAMKLSEKQFKATGDAETYMQNKTQQLNQKLAAQQSAVKSAEAALKQMKANGVDPLSASYQKMETTLLNAQSAVLDTQSEINSLGTESSDAAGKTDKLAASLGGLNKTVSLEAVINGVGRVTTALENAGKRAVELGKALFDEIMDKAAWADDSATMAMMYGVDLDTFLKVQKLVQNGMDTSVDAILGSQQKLRKGIGSESKEIMDILQQLELTGYVLDKTGEKISVIDKDNVDLFWEAGRAIMAMTDEFKQEDYAQKLFGKSWRELIPLFKDFTNQEEFRAGLETVRANTEEEVSKLAELNDAVAKLQGNFDTLETKVLAGLAPALTTAADALSGLLGNILDYLETPEGQQALADMEKAVSGLFSDLGEIDPEQVVSGFAKVFGDIVNGITWISENWEGVKTGIEGIGLALAGLHVAEGVVTFLQLVNGMKTLFGGGAAGAAAAGAEAGTAWGGAFSSAVSAAIQTIPFIAPIALLIERMGFNQELVNEATELGNQSIQEYQEKSAEYNQENPMYALWDMLTKATTVNGTGEDSERLKEFAQHYFDWFNENVEDSALHELTEGMTDEQYDNFHEQMAKILAGEMFYSEDEKDALLKALEDAKSVAEGILQQDPAKIPVTLPEGAEEFLQSQLNMMTLGVTVTPWVMEPDGEHANGLPSVPFDGYHAILHKGERVVPARAMSNTRNYNSNLYVENMVMNNGQDAEGLAAKVAAAQRWTNRGYGG